MNDQPEKMSETEDVEADFEGQKLSGPEKLGDMDDVKSTADDDGADFEGHMLGGGQDGKISKIF